MFKRKREILAKLYGNNVGVPLRQQLLDGAPFLAELTHTAVPQRAAPGTTATFTRATTATFTDFEGVLRTAPAGCARFVGARFVRNLFALGSENFTTANWTKVNGAFSGAEFTASGASSGFYQTATLDTGRTFLVWAKLSCESGTVATGLFANGVPVSPNPTTSSITVTTTPTIFSLTVTTTSTGSVNAGVGVYNAVPNGSSITVHEIQLEDITGRADQTTPSEYVSVGVESAPYHGAGADGCQFFDTDLDGNPIPSSTLLGYLAEGARTNVLLHSNDLSNAAWSKPGPLAIAQNEIGVDGAISAWTLTDDNVGVDENVNQASVKTAATWTDSCYFKKTTGAQATYPVFYAFDGATRVALCTVDTTNGVATVWTAYTGLTVQPSVARCRSFNDDKWFVELSFTATAATWTTTVDGAGTTNATQSTGTLNAALTGSCVVERLQSELGSFATSYIPTTTVAVTRNADVLTYTGGDIPNLKTLMAGFRREVGVSSVGVHASLYSDATHYIETYLAAATEARFIGQDGVVQWNTAASNAYVPGTTSMMAQTWSSNDIKMAKDGIAQTSDTTAATPTITSLGVGHVADGFQLSGNVGGIYGWTRNLSQSELNAVTA